MSSLYNLDSIFIDLSLFGQFLIVLTSLLEYMYLCHANKNCQNEQIGKYASILI